MVNTTAVKLPVLVPVSQPDCLSFPCHQECCSEGCDVWPREREALLAAGVATAGDFSEAYEDEEGDVLFRTALGRGGLSGCIFLLPTRGCRLHSTGLKPEVCSLVPRNHAEADEMQSDGMLPCRQSWGF